MGLTRSLVCYQLDSNAATAYLLGALYVSQAIE